MPIPKADAEVRYESVYLEEHLTHRPWVRLTRSQLGKGPDRVVEIPRFALHILRRATRILEFDSEEGP